LIAITAKHRAIASLLPDEPETLGLLALMPLHHSRRDARLTADGEPVLLGEQDRSAWHHNEIVEGLELVERALRIGRPGAYQVQAAIAALHAQAPTADATDWREIVSLYEVLLDFNASPVVELNRAASVAMAAGPEQGLALIERLHANGALEEYRWFHSSRGELLRRVGRFAEATAAYERALPSRTTPRSAPS